MPAWTMKADLDKKEVARAPIYCKSSQTLYPDEHALRLDPSHG